MIPNQTTPIESKVEPVQIVSPVTSLAGGASATAILSIPVPKGVMLLIEAIVKAYDATAGEVGLYKLTATISNKAGTTALVGSATVVAYEDDATWVATIAANNSSDAAEIQCTPDGTNATKFQAFVTVLSTSLAL